MEFNHISKTNPHREELQEYFDHYHRLKWCHHKKYKTYKHQSFIIDGIIALVVAVSTATAITLTPFASIASTLCIGFNWLKRRKKWNEKAQNFKVTTAKLNHILVELRSHLRSDTCDIHTIQNHLKEQDEFILSIIPTPHIEKNMKRYKKMKK